ncbi:GNAT family N-acetyltransferase [Paraburkholderia sp. CNPSo 3274]|uniref:GNAT family N-acetyltransferase n=1 Tax=Paraburkholderia sp. CNPSo 3274 TaxID=2940932 RepID=UPI0020B78AF9|nr:GNAT family N-acetyltransferase [Paraburkholderia sp. CNPSo 3274]MCP3710690.1 GNAT family N-acetyltransferase [Paraburkholderia sp. CNPSo 3274]
MDTTAIALARCEKTGAIADVPAEAIRHLWKAKDGTGVLLRSIEPGDYDIEEAFVNGLSQSTRYKRLMSARRPTSDEIHRWTHIDRRREGAVIAVIVIEGVERQVGVARYAMEKGDHDAGECAIAVSDAWQRRGLGAQLLTALIELARRSGLKRLYGTTLAENEAMVGLALRFGFQVSYHADAGYVWDLSLALTPLG